MIFEIMIPMTTKLHIISKVNLFIHSIKKRKYIQQNSSTFFINNHF